MSKLKKIISDLREAVGFESVIKQEEVVEVQETVEEVVEVKLEDVKSGDLTLRISPAVEVGASVAQVSVDENGEEVLSPVEDGEYPLENGMTLMISNSTITEIVETSQPEVEVEVEEEVKLEAEVEAENISQSILDISEIIKQAKLDSDKSIAELKDLVIKLQSELEEVKGQPASKKIEMKKSTAEHVVDKNKSKKEHIADLFARNRINNI